MIKTAGGTATNNVSRTHGTFPVNTGDWSLILRFRYPATPGSSYINLLSLFAGGNTFAVPYIFIGSDVTTSDLYIDSDNGVTEQFTTGVAVTNVTQHWLAVTYNSTTHALTIYLDGVSAGSVTINLSAVTWDRMFLMGDGSVALSEACSVAYLRAWSSLKSIVDLTAEAASITPVSQMGLIFDNPLQTSIDLTAHNNTFNHFGATGTVTTDTTDPLLSIVAGPPTNTTPASAIEVTTDSAYFQNVNTAAVATTVWHKFTANDDYTYGFDYFGDLTTYKPQIFIYEGLANANSGTTYLDFGNAVQQNLPIQFPVTSGNVYYFKALRNGAVAASTLQVSLIRALELPVPVGSIAVSDDIQNYSSAFLDLATGYPLFFQKLPIFGEGGSILTDGKLVLSESIANDKPILFDADLNVLSEIDLVHYDVVSSNGVDEFILGETGQNPAILKLVSSLGVIDPTDFNLGGLGVNSLGLNNNSSKVYWTSTNSNNTPVKTWNLLTNSADADLAAGVANYYSIPQDILVLSNGDIIVARNKPSVTRNYLITNYNAAGSTQHTYDFGLDQDANNRVFSAIDNPNSFWTWIKLKTAAGLTRTGLSRFVNVKTSDGTFLHDLNGIMEYESGIYAGITATNTPVRFGHAESCPAWIVRTGSISPTVNPRSGIYYLTGTSFNNPGQRHDTLWIDASLGTTEDVKIP